MTRGRWLLLLGLLAALGLALLLYGGRNAGRVPPRLGWDKALEGPSLMLGFLAERAQDGRGIPDWRMLPESGRHLWASLRFEHVGLAPQPVDPDLPPPPGLAEVAAAYDALGLPEAAAVVRDLQARLDAGAAAADPAVRATLARFDALRSACEPARHRYAVAHREDLDRPRY